MGKNDSTTVETRDYIGWVEEFHEGPVDGFAVLDLLHPDEVHFLLSGRNFADLMERKLEDGLKTLPIVLRFSEMAPAWKAAIARVVRTPQRTLTVRLSDERVSQYGGAQLALGGSDEDGRADLPIYISNIGVAPFAVAAALTRALSTTAFLRVASKPGRTSITPPPGSRKRFLRDILEHRVRSEDIVYAAVYDVGQGSASAIVDSNEHPRVFFDLGKPVSVFNHTRPSQAPQFFKCDEEKSKGGSSGWLQAPVVLSHWDFDHWAGVLKSFYVRTDAKGEKYAVLTITPNALERYWIAPDQEHLALGPTHRELIRQLLKTRNGGTGRSALQYWPPHLQSIAFSHGVIVKAVPDAQAPRTVSSKRNNSGLAMLITNRDERTQTPPVGLLLQGDARLESIPLDLNAIELVGIVVSHHGGKLASVPQAAAGTTIHHARFNAVCSVGRADINGDTPYGHPHDDAMKDHDAAGWDVVFTHTAATPSHCKKALGNYVLSLDSTYPQCGCDCACGGNLSLNPI